MPVLIVVELLFCHFCVYIPADDSDTVSYDAMSHSQSPITVYTTIAPSVSDWNSTCNLLFQPVKQPLPEVIN